MNRTQAHRAAAQVTRRMVGIAPKMHYPTEGCIVDPGLQGPAYRAVGRRSASGFGHGGIEFEPVDPAGLKLMEMPMDTDLSTAQKALHALQSAYRAHDMDLAATYRDFGLEAQLVLQHLDKRPGAVTAEAIAQLATTLEAKWRQAGPPDLAGVTTRVTATEHYADCFYVVTEEVRTADGRVFSHRLFLSQSGGPWAVLCPYATPRQEQKPWWVFWG
jgi:hypothetical protein